VTRPLFSVVVLTRAQRRSIPPINAIDIGVRIERGHGELALCGQR
jgi:hypothetical protein